MCGQDGDATVGRARCPPLIKGRQPKTGIEKAPEKTGKVKN